MLYRDTAINTDTSYLLYRQGSDGCARPSAVCVTRRRAGVARSGLVSAVRLASQDVSLAVSVSRGFLRVTERPRHRRTRHNVASALVTSQYRVARPPLSVAHHKCARAAMSQNERFGTVGGSSIGATSQLQNLRTLVLVPSASRGSRWSGARVVGAATGGAGMMAELSPVPLGSCRGPWRERRHRTVPSAP